MRRSMPAGYKIRGALEQCAGARMEARPGPRVGLAGAGARESALEQNTEFEAGEYLIPGKSAQVPIRMGRVMLDELRRARKSVPGLDLHRRGIIRARPGRQYQCEVKQRLANRSQLPIDDRGEL